MYKYNNSQLPATFSNYFKLITDVHPYNTRQIKNSTICFYQKCAQTHGVEVHCNRNLGKNSIRNKK